MANRPRLDEGVLLEVYGFIVERLDEFGYVPDSDVARIATLVDRSERQVRRWVEDVRAVRGLSPRRSRRQGCGEYDSSVEAFVAGAPFVFDDDMCTVAHAYAGNIARLHADAERLAGDDVELLSYSQLNRKFNAEVGNDHRKLMREGIKGFKSASLYLRWSASERNEVWQIDATELDIWVTPKGTGTPVRPWGLFIIDDRTRVILGATIMLHEYNAADAASCVHRAIRAREVTLPDGTTTVVGGIPGKILCDNALQFTGELLTTVAMDLSFTMWAVAVYMGEKKGKVERAIRSVNEELCRTLPGYATPKQKTLTMSDALRGGVDDALDEIEFLEELGRWVEAKNNSPHPTVRTKSRYEVWAQDPAQIRLASDEQLQAATVPLRSINYVFHSGGFGVQRDGVVTHYIAEALAGRVGDKFHLRHLPGETSWVDAYEPDGTFVARCWNPDLLTEDQRKDLERNRRERYRTAASRRSAAVELRSIAATAADDDAGPNPLAVAATRAQVPAAPDMIAASLGLEHRRVDPDTGEIIDVEPFEEDDATAIGPGVAEERPMLELLDQIAADAVSAAQADAADIGDPPPTSIVNPAAPTRRSRSKRGTDEPAPKREAS